MTAAAARAREEAASEASAVVARARDEVAQASAQLQADQDARQAEVERVALDRQRDEREAMLAEMERLVDSFRKLDAAQSLSALARRAGGRRGARGAAHRAAPRARPGAARLERSRALPTPRHEPRKLTAAARLSHRPRPRRRHWRAAVEIAPPRPSQRRSSRWVPRSPDRRHRRRRAGDRRWAGRRAPLRGRWR